MLKNPIIVLIIITGVIFSSCGLSKQKVYAQQVEDYYNERREIAIKQAENLKKNFRISEGMSKDEVYQIMGTPSASEFDKGVEEWHYCATGTYTDEFVAFYFNDGKVVAKTSYTVTTTDVGGVTGDCSKFIKRGTYKMPDAIIELRNTY